MSTDRRKMIRIIARRLGVAIPFGQRSKGPRIILVQESPTNLVRGSEGAVVVDEGAFRNLAGRTMSGWRKRIPVSVLITVCGYVWTIRRIRRKPKSGHVEGFLSWEGTRRQVLCQVASGRRLLPDERKRSIVMDHQNWFNGLDKDASKYEDQRTVLTRCCCLPERCSSGVEETSNIQD